jgi:hypothetical protein
VAEDELPQTIARPDDPEQEAEAVAGWISNQIEHGVQPHEIG